jgi:ketosteroid isomerase-like protein
MSADPQVHLDTARSYLAALEKGEAGEALAHFFTDDVVQEEFPNRLSPDGIRRDLDAILDSAARGARILSAQRYRILGEVAADDHVALEVDWTGTLAMPLAGLPVGGMMRARFAVFLHFRDGRIARQRNYDCFFPW